MSNMKTALLTLGIRQGTGGPNRSVRAFAELLEADVVSWVDPHHIHMGELSLDSKAVVQGGEMPLLKKLLYPRREGLRAAEEIISSADFVSCHSFWRWHNLWMSRVAAKFGTPYWFVPHGALDPYVFEGGGMSKRLFLRMGGLKFVEEASCVIFSSRAERDKAMRICRPKAAEVLLWPLADSDFIMQERLRRRVSARKQLNLPESSMVLLYFGRLHSMKRPLETIEALAASMTDAHLLVAGNTFDVDPDACRKHAEKFGISERVHVLGPKYGEDKIDILAATDAYVSFSKRENFNYTAAESMAAGLPVVLSPGNDICAEIEGVEVGLCLENDDISAMADSIHRLCSFTPETLSNMGASAEAWARQNLARERFDLRIHTLVEKYFNT